MSASLALAMAMFSALAGDGSGAPAPAGDCPSRQAVEAEIGRLGPARVLALAGTPDVTVQGASMRIVLRGRDGQALGRREVAAPATCPERAVVAAVVIAAWLGEWASAGSSAAPTPAALPPAPPAPAAPPAAVASPAARAPAPVGAPPLLTASRTVVPAPGTPVHGELATFAFGTHDGDVGTWGLGAQAGYGLGRQLSVIALGEWIGARAQPLGPGQADYRAQRFGAGAALRATRGRLFIDGSAGPQAVRLSVRGEGLVMSRRVVSWGLALDGRVRVGLRLGWIAPFVYTGASYALNTARLTLDNRSDSVTLSRWGFSTGIGLLFPLGWPAG